MLLSACYAVAMLYLSGCPGLAKTLLVSTVALTLTLEPAANGPVMDRLRLVNGTVLVTDDTPHDADVEHDR